jgi:hypothetical protein
MTFEAICNGIAKLNYHLQFRVILFTYTHIMQRMERANPQQLQEMSSMIESLEATSQVMLQVAKKLLEIGGL